jgi:hypothetical protein
VGNGEESGWNGLISTYCRGLSCQRRWNLSFVTLGPPSVLYNEYRIFFPGVKRPGRELTTHPHLPPRLRKSRAIPPLPLCVFMACYRINFKFYSIVRCSYVHKAPTNPVKWGPKPYRVLKFVMGLSDWIPFFEQKTVLWISVMRSGRNFANNCRGAPIVESWNPRPGVCTTG